MRAGVNVNSLLFLWLKILKSRSGGWTLEQIGSRIAQTMKQVRNVLHELLCRSVGGYFPELFGIRTIHVVCLA